MNVQDARDKVQTSARVGAAERLHIPARFDSAYHTGRRSSCGNIIIFTISTACAIGCLNDAVMSDGYSLAEE